MKKFLIKLSFFALCFIVIDLLFGQGMRWYEQIHIPTIATKDELVADSIETDLLVMGSSRAVHHYDTNLLQDSLGISCFNCAWGGRGIVNSYAQYAMLSKRYKPKYIILDIAQWFDYLEGGDDATKYLGALKPFFDREEINDVFWHAQPQEWVKMHSYLYQYNSRFPESRDPLKTPAGFNPIDRTMDYEPVINDVVYTPTYDKMKVYFLERLVDECKEDGVKLVMFVSPRYNHNQLFEFDYVIDLAKRKDIPFVMHYQDENIFQNKEYFCDQDHLNARGAEAYTKTIVPECRELFDL